MSNISYGCFHDPEDCIPVHPIAYWARQAGWIRDAEAFEPEPGTTTTISLFPPSHGLPPPGGYLMAEIPRRGSAFRSFTLEARTRDGWDSEVPDDAVIIHSIDSSVGALSYVLVDVDGNELTNDDGARWVPGETFTDADSGIEVRIDERHDDGSFVVTITSPPRTVRPFDRTIHMKIIGHLSAYVSLRVPDGPPECKVDVPLRLQRRTPRGWETLRRFRTGQDGDGGTHIDAEHVPGGWYRTYAPKVQMGWDVCRAAFSNRVHVTWASWYQGK